jgi:PLP dependent protein
MARDLTLGDRLAVVRARIAAAAPDPGQVRLVAVTKGFGADVVTAALAAGLVDLGESYVQELVAKATEVDRQHDLVHDPGQGPGHGHGRGHAVEPPDDAAPLPAPRWHAIGRLQRNKVRKAAPFVTLWHSVDRLSLGAEIARWAPGASVLVQVNTSGEEAKGGCSPAMAAGTVEGLIDLGLDVQGLMTIAPAGPPEVARPAFHAARELRDRLGLSELSMGMTGDLEVALSEGATLVRVGSGLFGPRPGGGGARH